MSKERYYKNNIAKVSPHFDGDTYAGNSLSLDTTQELDIEIPYVLGVTQTPALHTSLISNTGTISVSSVYNDSGDTNWQAWGPLTQGAGGEQGWLTLNGSLTGWFQYEFNTPVLVSDITLNGAISWYQQYPEDIEFQVSDDGVNFITIYSATGQSVPDSTTLINYIFDNPKSGKYFRINISHTSGSFVGFGTNMTFNFKEITTPQAYLTYFNPDTKEFEQIANQDDLSSSTYSYHTDFNVDDGWNLPTGSSIEDGFLKIDGIYTSLIPRKNTVLPLNKYYGFELELKNYQQGYFNIKIAAALSTEISNNGVKSEVIGINTINGDIQITSNLNFYGDLDYLNIKQVLPISTHYKFTDQNLGEIATQTKPFTQADIALLNLEPELLGKLALGDLNTGLSLLPSDVVSWYAVSEEGDTVFDAISYEPAEDLALFSFEAEGAIVTPGVLQVQKPNDRLGDFTVDRNSIATYVDASGVIQTAGVNEARIDYTNGVAELLCEPQSTNLIPWSEKISNFSTAQGGDGSLPIITDNYSISPDGVLNMSRIILEIGDDTNSSNISRIWISSVLDIGLSYTYSFYIKSNTVDSYGVQIKDSDGNLPIGYIQNVTPEIQKIVITETSTKIGNSSVGFWLRGGSGSDTYADISIWGIHMEELPYPTSYIKTEGSTVTRLGDIIKDGANVNVINSEEGVLFIEMSAFSNNVTNRFISISNASNDNDSILFALNSLNNVKSETRVGGVTQSNITISNDASVLFKTAIKWKLNDLAVWIDSVEEGIDVSCLTPTTNTLIKINLGTSNSSLPVYGRIRKIRIYNRALTDTELALVTS